MLKHRIQDYGSIKLIKSEKKAVLSKQACTEQNVFAAFSPQRVQLWKEAGYEHLKSAP